MTGWIASGSVRHASRPANVRCCSRERPRPIAPWCTRCRRAPLRGCPKRGVLDTLRGWLDTRARCNALLRSRSSRLCRAPTCTGGYKSPTCSLINLSHLMDGYCWSTPKCRKLCLGHAFVEGPKSLESNAVTAAVSRGKRMTNSIRVMDTSKGVCKRWCRTWRPTCPRLRLCAHGAQAAATLWALRCTPISMR